MNPYAKYLDGREPMAVLADTPGLLRLLLDAGGSAVAERALAPGKWTVRQILCHLADTELAFAFRLRQAAAEPHHVIQPFDQDAWALNYGAFDSYAALAAFAAVRNWNLALIGTLPAATFSKPVTHPERGRMTFQVLVETMAGHDLNHLGQIERIAQQ
jgi:hypothetical protein